MHTQAEQQIFAYIRGKVGISLLVATVDAGFLRFVGLDLWLVFGVLAFLLNFIPNVGMATSVLLPMPLDDPLRLHQRGREAIVRPGDLAMVATCDTYCYEQRSVNRHRTLRLPGPLLRRRVPRLRDRPAQQRLQARAPFVDRSPIRGAKERAAAQDDERARQTCDRRRLHVAEEPRQQGRHMYPMLACDVPVS